MGKKFERPSGSLQELEADELAAAVEAAYAAAEELAAIEDDKLTDEQFAELADIDGFVSEAKAENEVREAAAAERANALAAIRANLTPAEEEEAPAEEAPAEEAPAEEAPAEQEQPEQAQAAAVKRPANFAARAAKRVPATAPVQAPRASLVAAANVGGFEAGQKFGSLLEGAQVIQKRFGSMPKNAPTGTLIQNTALNIVLPENEFSQTNDRYAGSKKDEIQMLLDAGNESRLEGGSLVAAGGWGAPSEQSLDFCELESIEGLLSLPEVGITRGGISYTKGPVFADVLANSTGFWDMTEAEAEAGTELKTSLRPSIPTFTEQRLDAVGVMMEAGLLLRQGWPEVIARYSDLLLKAHAYKMAQKKLAGIHGFTGAAKAAGPGFGNALDILHILELVATGERQRTFMSPSQTLEAIIPHWVKNVVRVDLANRNGVEFKTVTDAEIDGHFSARGIKVQWVTAVQNLVIDGVKNIALKYPDTVDIVMYPAGTYVAGVAPVITLDTIYDSTNLKKNDYVELFVEQGLLVTNPCGDGVRISLPLYANGRRAIDNITNNFGTAAI